jgi:hypothetical protein
MKMIKRPAVEIPVIEEVDVLVTGGGPAGIGAALASARNGVKTMLIEQFGDVGGVATVGMMSHWTGQTRGGIYEEILDRSSTPGFGRHLINTEILKTVLLEMLEESGVIIRLYTLISDVLMEENRITGVVLESKSGSQAVMAKRIIDCTGDGDTAARAGAPFFKGRESDGKMQPMTLMFKMAGVDKERTIFPGGFESNIEIPGGGIQDLGKARLPHPMGHVLIYDNSLSGVVTLNMTNVIGVDGTRAEDLTRAQIEARKQMPHIAQFLKDTVPGFEEAFIISSASFMGIRETRHFKGESMITEEDIKSARTFEDWAVTRAHFNFDVHNITGSGLDKTGAQKKFKQKKSYTIPYGCLIPLKVENLLLAGRNISGTHLAHSNYRVMPICVNMGQAAGTAAALSIKEGIIPRELNVKSLQSVLLDQGVWAPE